jgi:hypothetical protein
MAGMPAIVPNVRWLGYDGSYALKATFPHGGFYRIGLKFEPSVQSRSTSVSYLVEVADELSDDRILPRPFSLKVSAEGALTAGKPSQLLLSVWSSETDQRVTNFETVHEKKLHLIVVRGDLGAFFHEHPTLHPDGTFTVAFTFPTGGNWTLFADMAPQGAGSQVAAAKLRINGVTVSSKDLIPVEQPIVHQDGLLLEMEPVHLVAHRTTVLVFKLRDANNAAPSDLEPWLGAPAHLMLVERDATTFVHSHPNEGSDQAVKSGILAFETRFPKPGVYKGWVQVQRAGRVITLPFTIRVPDSVTAQQAVETAPLP